MWGHSDFYKQAGPAEVQSRYRGGMKAEQERWLLGNNPPSIYELWSPREPEETW